MRVIVEGVGVVVSRPTPGWEAKGSPLGSSATLPTGGWREVEVGGVVEVVIVIPATAADRPGVEGRPVTPVRKGVFRDIIISIRGKWPRARAVLSARARVKKD